RPLSALQGRARLDARRNRSGDASPRVPGRRPKRRAAELLARRGPRPPPPPQRGAPAPCAAVLLPGLIERFSTLAAVEVPERLQPVLAEVAPLAERFTRAGHTLYLVGGVVRDLLANRSLDDRDLDFTTDARPDATEALLSGWADALCNQGKRFGTIGAKKGDRHLEVTTHRAEAYWPYSPKPDVAAAAAVEAYLASRDFTVNAMS